MLETTNYMTLGYAVVFLILVGVVVYLVMKARNLREELHTLETLDAEDRVVVQQRPPQEVAREPIASREPRSGDMPL